MNSPLLLNELPKRFAVPCVIGLAAAIAVLSAMWTLNRNITTTHEEQVRAAAVRSLAAVRGAAELAINRRIHLLVGLKAHVTVNPDMSPEEFQRVSQLITSEVDGIRSVTSIRDNVINDVYPRDGNEGAIGLNLMEHPRQRAAALRAIETRKAWLDGPIRLVQGGDAFIHRSPVFYRDKVDGTEKYWGMVSLLIDRDTLAEDILTSVPKGFEVAIRNRTLDGAPGEVFLGSPETLTLKPIITEITLPTGSWQLYGVRTGGWPTAPPHAASIQIVGVGCSVLIGLLAFTLAYSHLRTLRYADRLEQASEEASDARQKAEHVSYQLAVEAVELQRYADRLEKAKAELATSNEALERSNRELEQFAYVASHDLQEPLRKVSSFCDLLAEDLADRLDDTGRTYMSYIVDAAARMRALIQDLLALSRVNSVDQPLEEFDSQVAIRNALRNLTMAIEESAAEIDCTGSFPTVWCRPSHLTQLFQNLISNGIKYRSDCPPRIRVSVEQQGDEWVFSVADNGIGIAPKYHEQIFGIFKRLHRRDEYTGTGIGLAICRRITERWSGRMWIDSEQGEGATFCFTIPVAPSVAFDRSTEEARLGTAEPQPV